MRTKSVLLTPNETVSTRAERKAQADARRKGWRLRWIDLGRAQVRSGKTVRESLIAIATDAAGLMTANPTLRSEIDRAYEEFLTSMRNVLNAARELQSGHQT